MSVIALLQARDEERFLPGWLANVAPCVDGIVALDDGSTDRTAEILADHPKVIELRQNPPGEAWDERANQVALVKAGRELGADWLLCLDADERLETRFVEGVGDLLGEADRDGIDVFRFHLRELWGDPHHYRADGIWGKKMLCRLFRSRPGDRRFDPRKLHRFWMPLELVAELEAVSRHTELNIYHLRMILPEDRAKRAARYLELDPDALYQPQGYDYLLDESNLALVRIPPERGFSPVEPVAREVSRLPG